MPPSGRSLEADCAWLVRPAVPSPPALATAALRRLRPPAGWRSGAGACWSDRPFDGSRNVAVVAKARSPDTPALDTAAAKGGLAPARFSERSAGVSAGSTLTLWPRTQNLYRTSTSSAVAVHLAFESAPIASRQRRLSLFYPLSPAVKPFSGIAVLKSRNTAPSP